MDEPTEPVTKRYPAAAPPLTARLLIGAVDLGGAQPGRFVALEVVELVGKGKLDLACELAPVVEGKTVGTL
jgi:hypothetical protein